MAQQNPITGSFGAVAAADAAGVHVAGLNKSFGANHVLRGIDLEVAPGEADQVRDILEREMDSAIELNVPLEVSAGSGKDWDAAAH